ncbi:Uncharacterized protein PECH_002022 [Penicillium ucsense]|uniref:RING-type E3 ubiquitin transferase n=1 Tax=Penicillium ucsense TaxID=2839758 RepID=A0A8J8W5M4_9EURO|nr:Uncharacterized protein PECM_004321 [Penicillium ucsense]KAF7731302.1 Uncharacterized protein PECH_002022 [Penicillium ucsense]
MGLFAFLLSFLALSVLTTPASAHISIAPSNDTSDLAWTSSANFRLHSSKPLSDQSLAPLTHYLVNLSSTQAQALNLQGRLVRVTATNSLSINNTDIAAIPCDNSPADYPGELGVDQTVQSVITAAHPPAAVILYSTSASHCNLTTDDQVEAYRFIFTLRDFHAVGYLDQLLHTFSDQKVQIQANMSSFTTSTTSNVDSSGSSGGSSSGGGSTNSPNTAMIILYSITGIITALFLGIIITGAVRAHRHPERYGPRRIAGRPRQSRARGIAQAMLDTIPVVKFGDSNEVDAAKRDVEMANAEDHPTRSPSRSENVSEIQQTSPLGTNHSLTQSEGIEHSPRDTVTESSPAAAPDSGNFSCPICTDDFVVGQDLRVLPCNHQFHPECIDPWLVNVSGTCPLCRIDLNPPKPEENAESGAENADGQTTEPPADGSNGPAAAAGAQQNRHSRRLSNYLHGPLNARRMRNATVEERLDALRRVREANQGGATADLDSSQRNRNRLSSRLRERFRIRTHSHGGDNPVQEGSELEPPTEPPAAHTTH